VEPEPGATIEPYERPSRFEKNVVRTLNNPNGQSGAQGARTPHHLVNGAITRNGLHFVVSHGGAPDVDPDEHRLMVDGLVKRPLVFTFDALARYPMTTRVTFLECGGNAVFTSAAASEPTGRCTGLLPVPSGPA
jgi:sulfane dehydrogenase subunit SoxC